MKIKSKKILGIVGLVLSVGFLTACNSFCNDQDTSAYRFGYDSLNVNLFDSREDALIYANTKVPAGYQKITYDTQILDKNGNKISLISEDTFGEYNLYYIHTAKIRLPKEGDPTESVEIIFGKNDFVQSVETTCVSSLINVPYNQFYEELDKKVLDNIYTKSIEMGDSHYKTLNKADLSFKEIYGYSFEDYIKYVNSEDKDLLKEMLNGNSNYVGRNNCLLTKYGYSKFYSKSDSTLPFLNLEKWNDEIIKANINEFGMNTNFLTVYENSLNTKVAQIKTCIAIEENGLYGHISNDPLNETVPITNKAKNGFFKSWGSAFKEHGFLEGLLVFPISYGVESLSHAFGMNGWGQIFAVLLVTVIIRTLLAAVSFPSTMQQQKMNFIQPEVAKLQQKYPNANTNQYEKQRLSQAQMALYKKYKIHPFLSILVLIVQFPLFICVWNAMTGSASLSSDSVMGLYLSETIWNTLKAVKGWPNIPGWWTALVLILLMSAGQIFAMLLPQWLNKKRMKNVRRTNVSQTQQQSDKTTKVFSYVMTGMVIIMGFTLPSAMGVYWFAGALFSIVQTLVTQAISNKKGY